jgi:hypothetical protein
MQVIVGGQNYFYNGYRVIKPAVASPVTKEAIKYRKNNTRTVAVVTQDRDKATKWQVLPAYPVWEKVKNQILDGDYIVI